MKGGSANHWATQRVNQILHPVNPVMPTWEVFTEELEVMFADPNCEATARRKLAMLYQGDRSVEDLIC